MPPATIFAANSRTESDSWKRSTSLEVTAPSYSDQTPIFKTDGLFPVRLPVRLIAEAVAFLLGRRRSILADAGIIGSYDNAISFNKVTGYSINVPIGLTCKPTATCIKTCYFATGAPSWSSALRHQARIFESIKADPIAFAERVALEYDRLGLTFLRWNGGGDLFRESVEAINHLGRIRPGIILWVVTRIPEFAAQIDALNNVFIHFSLDKHSLPRREQFLRFKPRSKNYFFSYQCEPGESPDPNRLGHAAVLFFDNYRPTGSVKRYEKEIVCPLNGKEDISGTCIHCRRCFDGTAVSYERKSIRRLVQARRS